MSKHNFQGQSDAPAPAQGPNQGVFDNPTHGDGESEPQPVAKTRPIDTNDHSDKSEFARRHNARLKNEGLDENHLTQKGEDHGENFLSGLNASQKKS